MHNMANRMARDPYLWIRVKALSALNSHFSETRKLKSVTNDKLLEQLARTCFDSNAEIQRLALIVSTKAYISLMKAYPPGCVLPPLERVGRLPAVLTKVSLKSSGRARAMVENFLTLIELFLTHQQRGESYPVEAYFQNKLMTNFWN